MIRVLHLRSGSGLYGADRALLALAGATPAPFQPVVGSIVREGVPDLLCDEAARLGLERRTFRSAGRLDLALIRAVRAEARRGGVELFHAHDFKSLWVALFAGLAAGIPVVATYHGETAVTPAVRAYEILARILGNFTRGVFAVSRPLHATLSRWVRLAPVAFAPNAVAAAPPPTPEERAAARATLGFGETDYVVAVIGRLSPEKGHAVLLEAARRLERKPVLVFAGDGPSLPGLQAAQVPARLLGYLPEPRPVLAAADVIAIPSLTEGLPLIALEALAAGRCVVATTVGALPELLGGGAGLLVPPGDPTALALALESARDPVMRLQLTTAGADRVRSYDVASMASAYARAYRAALPASPAGGLASNSR